MSQSKLDQFISIIKSEFPEDRLTWQKSVPTFHPENAEDASQLLMLANKNRQRIFITGFGNNIDPQGEPFVSMISIRTDRLNKLHELNPPDFYVKVGAGYPLRELRDDLQAENLFMPLASSTGTSAWTTTGGLQDVFYRLTRDRLVSEVPDHSPFTDNFYKIHFTPPG